MKQPKAKVPKPVTFETALGWLRSGKAVRRRSWHVNSRIFRLGSEVFVKLPNLPSPSTWHPYAADVLANDWVIA